jgi:hypothetical protein
MERKLSEHDDRNGWLYDCDDAGEDEVLMDRLLEEVEEMTDSDGDDEMINEAADVANFAMMIAERARIRISWTKP